MKKSIIIIYNNNVKNFNSMTNKGLYYELYMKFGKNIYELFVRECFDEKMDSMYDCFRTWAIDKLTK